MISEEQPPIPTINLPLPDYLILACRGIENTAIVSQKFGTYITLEVDPAELFCHVEFLPETKLAQLYPIKEWKDSLKRREQQQQQSEVTRQIRFALEQEQATLKAKLQRRRDILAELIVDVKKLFPGITQKLAYKYGILNWKQQEEWLEYTCYRALIGEHKTAIAKFNISAETIAEFATLPADPEFKNRYFIGSKNSTEELK